MSVEVTAPPGSFHLAILLTMSGGERDEREGMSDDRAPDRDPPGVAGGAAGAGRRREGAHGAGGRGRPPAPAGAPGTGREGGRLPEPRRGKEAGRGLPRALPAAR